MIVSLEAIFLSTFVMISQNRAETKQQVVAVSRKRKTMSSADKTVALTGVTGFIGSHVLTELQEHGHEVMVLVRDDSQADIVASRGATPTVVDLYDRQAFRVSSPLIVRSSPTWLTSLARKLSCGKRSASKKSGLWRCVSRLGSFT